MSLRHWHGMNGGYDRGRRGSSHFFSFFLRFSCDLPFSGSVIAGRIGPDSDSDLGLGVILFPSGVFASKKGKLASQKNQEEKDK